MRVYDALDRTQAILRDPEHWGREDFAVDANGHPVDETDPAAVCFCTLGALTRATAGDYDLYRRAKVKLRQACDYRGNIAEFNDDPATTHADIMAMFDKAKELVQCL